MAALILPSRRVVQPQGPVEVDGGNQLGRTLGLHVSDFVGRDVVGQRFVTKTANLAYGVTTQGRGLSSAANAAFSSPLDLSSTNAITVAFILRQAGSTGTQILAEHTANYGTNAGGFVAYFDSGNLEAGIGGGGAFNVIRCAAPAVGRTTRIVLTIEYANSAARSTRVWYDGVEQSTTQLFSALLTGNFANSTTYFLGRGASSLFFNGVMHDVSLWRRKISDNEVREWSANPWQVYRPIQRRIWVPVAGGGGISQTVAFTLEDVSAAVSQTLSHDQSLTGTLDDVTVSISQTAEHDQALSATLDDVTVAISQTLGNATNQTLSITLDGVAVAAAQTLRHSQALDAALDGVTFAASQTLSHSQALAATLDGIAVAINQSAAPSSKEQSLAVVLDGIQVAIAQEGPANLIDTHDGFWAKEWARIRAREKRKYQAEVQERVEEIQDEIAEVEQQIVEVKQAPKPKKATPARDFYAEQARIVEHLIARRNQLIDEEDEELLLLL